MELGVDADLDSLGADIASTSGHEPHSEPSRTLFVRHINPTASDEELLAMFKVGRASQVVGAAERGEERAVCGRWHATWRRPGACPRCMD